MPTYDYRCPKCGVIYETRHSIHEDPVYTCPDCSEVLVKVFLEAPGLKFIGDGWETKDERRKRQFLRQRKTLERKQRDHVPKSHLIPNVQGEVVGSWKEAAELAEEKGLDSKPFLERQKIS